MIKEVLVVEGKQDVVAIRKAVQADCIITSGFSLKPYMIEDIRQAYEKRGIIIMTDPDGAGERIRRFLSKRFPNAKHAFVPKEDATANNDIGIEQASPDAIRTALEKVRYLEWTPTQLFTAADLIAAGLSGTEDATQRRAKVGAVLGIGYANAKTFLRRLNHYGVTKAEFTRAVTVLDAEIAEEITTE